MSERPNYGALFAKISSSSSSSSSGPSIEALYIRRTKGGSLQLQLLDNDPVLEGALKEGNKFFVYSAAAPPQDLEPLSRVLLENVHRKPQAGGSNVYLYCSNVQQKGLETESQHIPEDTNTTFLMSVPLSGSVQYGRAPGLCLYAERNPSETTWHNKKTGENQRKIVITGKQLQWQTEEDVQNESFGKPIEFKMILWEALCTQLPGEGLTSDLSTWRAIMAVHPVGFFALCQRNKKFSNLTQVAIDVLGIRWELKEYLENSGKCFTIPSSSALLPKKVSSAPNEESIVSITQLMAIPPGNHWKYYVMTSDPENVKDEKQINPKTHQFIILAAKSNDHDDEKPSATKKHKKNGGKK